MKNKLEHVYTFDEFQNIHEAEQYMLNESVIALSIIGVLAAGAIVAAIIDNRKQNLKKLYLLSKEKDPEKKKELAAELEEISRKELKLKTQYKKKEDSYKLELSEIDPKDKTRAEALKLKYEDELEKIHDKELMFKEKRKANDAYWTDYIEKEHQKDVARAASTKVNVSQVSR